MSKIEFIIPTYNRPDHLMCTINSIFSQRSDRWAIHVVSDCSPLGTIDKIIKYFGGDDRIRFTVLPKRYNDWGHTPRNYGVQNSKEDWIVMTGEDNYYMPVFVDHFLEAVTPEVDFVYCNMVHNWTNFQYHTIDCEPKWGKIDIGNFMIRRSIAKNMKLDEKIEQADGVYVEEFQIKNPYSKIVKINKTLYVHN